MYTPTTCSCLGYRLLLLLGRIFVMLAVYKTNYSSFFISDTVSRSCPLTCKLQSLHYLLYMSLVSSNLFNAATVSVHTALLQTRYLMNAPNRRWQSHRSGETYCNPHEFYIHFYQWPDYSCLLQESPSLLPTVSRFLSSEWSILTNPPLAGYSKMKNRNGEKEGISLLIESSITKIG